METVMTKNVVNADDDIASANELGDRVMASGLTLRQEIVRDQMSIVMAKIVPAAQFGRKYDEAIGRAMTDAAHRTHMILMLMTSIRPLALPEPEPERIASPASAIIVPPGAH